MSIPTKQLAERFLAPLRGKLAILVLHDLEAKFALTRLILGCARLDPARAVLLDIDAFYCTNIDRFAEYALSVGEARLVLLPETDFEMEALLPLLSSRTNLLVIDGLNSLYSLAHDGRRSQQLAIVMRLLSFNARMNGSWVMAVAYRNEQPRQGRADRRSLTALGDLVIDTDYRDGSLTLKAQLDDGWTNDELRI